MNMAVLWNKVVKTPNTVVYKNWIPATKKQPTNKHATMTAHHKKIL